MQNPVLKDYHYYLKHYLNQIAEIKHGQRSTKKRDQYKRVLSHPSKPWYPFNRLRLGIKQAYKNRKTLNKSFRKSLKVNKARQRIEQYHRNLRKTKIKNKFKRASRMFNILRKIQPGDRRNKYNPKSRIIQTARRKAYNRRYSKYYYKTNKFLNQHNKQTAKFRNYKRPRIYRRRYWKTYSKKKKKIYIYK